MSGEKGVNYTHLRNFLKARQWKEADKETLAVMVKAASREQEGWLSVQSIENFPCTDLCTIDQLWVKYSDGRFGFSVQKRIWESVGQDYREFSDRDTWHRGLIAICLNKFFCYLMHFRGDAITEMLLGSEWLTVLPLVVNYQAGILTFFEFKMQNSKFKMMKK